MLSLNTRRDIWPFFLRLLLILGLLSIEIALGLRGLYLPWRLILVAAAGAALALLALRDMALALTIFVVSAATVSFAIGTGTHSRLNVAMLLIGLLTGVWLLRMIVSRQLRLARTPLNLSLIAFLVAAAASWIYGLTLSGSWDYLPGNALTVEAGQYGIYALTAAAFLLAANHRVGERALQIWVAVIVAVGLAVMIGGVARGSYSVLPEWSGALYMWPVVFLSAQIIFNSRLDRRLKLVGLAGLGLWAYWALKVAIGYKSIFVPAGMALLLLVFLRSRRLFLGGVAVALVVVAALGSGRISTVLMAGEEYSATPIRANLWWDVFRLGAQSPILGLGPANYTYYWQDQAFRSLSFEQVNPYAFIRQIYAPPAHNMFADLFAQTGAVGLFLFTWALAGGLWLGWQAVKRPLSPFARAYAYAVLAGFASQIVASFVFAEWLLPYVYNLGFRNFPQAAYTWLLLGTLAWLGTPVPVKENRVP